MDDDTAEADSYDSPSLRQRVGTAAGDGLGTLSGAAIGLPLAIIGRGVHTGTKTALGLLSVLPISSPWRGATKWSLRQLHKSAGGDAIGLVHEPNGSVEPVPVKFKQQSVEEGGAERAGWHEFGGDRSWHEGADGREVDRLGKTPVVLLDSASAQRATATEARFAQCLDLDQVEGLYQLRDDGQVDITVQMGDASGTSAALPDGGAAWEATDAAIKGAVKDRALVDIGADDHDGMRIDPRKVKETYREKTGGEQLDEVERLGFLAGSLGEQDATGFVIKVLLIALGIVAAATIGPDLLSQASSGASGSSGVVPFMIGGMM